LRAGRVERDQGFREFHAAANTIKQRQGRPACQALVKARQGRASQHHGIGALRGPKHGGANEVAFEVQSRYANPDEAEADIRRRVEAKEVVIGFGHPVYTVSDPRNVVIKEVE
jgi:hypothetical protein